ncbi:mitogen-activated protein kinase [Teratosphaeriaceae sp. CCFEE 6253]|nr:mitogen-activated protein kinase [Teratosphaeriaceae sp. CCFEE 6253]
MQQPGVEADHAKPELEIHVPATRIGRYTDARHYNDGLFSEVFRATAPDPHREGNSRRLVALKVTNPDMMTAPHDSAREARILTAARCDHVITLIETFQQAGGRFVLVFPFMPYGLAGVLHSGKLTDASRGSILHDLFSGLAHIHGLDIMHRDIKPSNILLCSPSGPAYLSDFGISWSPTDAGSEAADQKVLDVGTTCYRPPELLFGHQAYGTALDMWAAGCVVAQVVRLNARTLFDAGDLGSELALIKSMFETLGTPNLDIWPEAAGFPDWGKMNFMQYGAKSWQDVLPGTDPRALDLVGSMVIFESRQRLSATEALNHPYLAKLTQT